MQDFIIFLVVDAAVFIFQVLQEDVFLEVDPLGVGEVEVLVLLDLREVQVEFFAHLVVHLAEQGVPVVHDVLVAFGQTLVRHVEEAQLLLDDEVVFGQDGQFRS